MYIFSRNSKRGSPYAAKFRLFTQKGKIVNGKHLNVVQHFSWLVLDVFPEGDQACKGCDQGSRSANVDTHQKLGVLIGKLRQKNGRGTVADDLAGQDTKEQRTLFQKEGEDRTDRLYPRHIPREDKKEYKGKQQRIVHHSQGLAVHK